MNIIDTTKEFFQLWEHNTPFTLGHLDTYYGRFPDIFDTYFKSHCTRTPTRLNSAIERYPATVDTMKRCVALLPSLVAEVYDEMSGLLQHALPMEIRLLVGGFGSNAYVTHDGTLHFAVELLPCETALLRVLIAHEMAHAFHFRLLTEAGFQFSQLAWDGYTSLYLEGLATFVSMLLNPGLPEAAYFSFDNSGGDWVSFCRNHYEDIKERINDDLQHWDMEQEIEWFRLRGGKTYGMNRLGYFIGTEFISSCVESIGLIDTMRLWGMQDIQPVVQHWMSGTPYPFE
ncbi:hypothetical protein [Alicyclobacillus sp. ALC3]|uniref:hypothetical protein n=1 Tax=Alicyclobacillus sp. ALC3 TaxID=2796143 RepID=UPI002377ECA5|nr:hypothetical protein [Alicyclobacillus sp. ALC3]WDL97156.1 hypothetical protein JC200_23345 [Alicyclobacillus sp. ALC3]